jgi:hypothetical protein
LGSCSIIRKPFRACNSRRRAAEQQRAGQEIASGYFAEEIIPISVPGGKAGPITVDKDEHPRPETTLEGLAIDKLCHNGWIERRGDETDRCVNRSIVRCSVRTQRQSAPRPTSSAVIEPALAPLVGRVPSDRRWIHEIKFDGYRVQVDLKDSIRGVGNDWTNASRRSRTTLGASARARRSSSAKSRCLRPMARPTSRFRRMPRGNSNAYHDDARALSEC